jgi:thymidylate kinase
MGAVIVIEGNCGVGKTTIATDLAERLGAALLHFPPGFDRFRQEADIDSAPALARLGYYLGAAVHLGALVANARSMGHVVCDRYIAAPLSLLEAEGALEAAELDGLSAPFLEEITAPDIVLLLAATHACAADRIRARAGGEGLRSIEALSVRSAEFFAVREAALRARVAALGPVVELDTTDLDIPSARAAAWGKMTERCR